VHERDNPNVVGTFTHVMPSGRTWRFHQWVYRNTAYIANYVERRTNVTTVYIGNLYEKNVTLGEETKYYYADGRRIAMRKVGGSNPGVYYLLGDHLGSTVGVVDSVGNNLRNSLFYSFGSGRLSPSSPGTDKLFTGQQLDSTGLYLMGARWYDPALGRWISPDTVVPDTRNPQSLNRYSYSFNNPIRYVDRDGHDPILALWETFFGRGVAGAGGDIYDDNGDLCVAGCVSPAPSELEVAAGVAEDAVGVGIFKGIAKEVMPTVGRFVGDLLGRAGPKATESIPEAVGQWVRVSRSISAEARTFQEYVTGTKSGSEFLRNGVHFDGVRMSQAKETILLEAKYAGAGADSFYSKVDELPFARTDVLNEAYRQMSAAKGLRIEWHMSDKTAWQAVAKLFAD